MSATRSSVLVTGASSGIGRAFACELPLVHDLILVGRDHDALNTLVGELESPRRTITVCEADLGNPAGVETVIEAARAVPLGGVINCAGLGSLGPFLENDPATEAATVAVNCGAVVSLTRALLPHLLDTADSLGERGFLLNVASTAAFAPVPQMAVYAASKAFVLSFTEALAAELASEPLDVVVLCPGATRSDFGRRAGFRFGSFPGALPPEKVARIGLQAIGRRQVAFTDTPSRVALTGLVRARAGLSRALNAGIGFVKNF